MAKLRPRALDDRGSMAVEFALIAPVLMITVMGILEFILVLYTHATAASTTRDVTRRIATNRLAAASADATVKDQLPGWVKASATVTVTQTTPGTAATNQIKVNVSFPANKATPTNYLNFAYGSLILNVSTTMQQEI